MKKYDAIIIGFGKGGKTLAADLAGQGKTVAMIEMSKQMYGGTCINVGCIPSKSLVNSSHMAIVKNLETFDEKAAFFAEAMAEKERVVTMLRGKNYAKLADHPNVTVYDGFGSFVTDHVVSIKGEAGEEQIEGEQIFINTGSHSFVPPIPGMKEGGRVMTSDGVLSLRELPKTLVIIGGGYISLEFANFFSNFGSRVVLVQRDDGFIPREDREIAAAVQQVLADKGVEFIFSAETKQLDEDADKVKVTLVTKSGELEIDAETVLIATGRQPNTKGLGLENAGVELTERGAVKVDEHMPKGASGVLCFGVKGGRAAGEDFLTHLELASIVVHVGDIRTSVLHPASTTHRQLSEADQLAGGIRPELIRASIGCENIDDIIADFDQALNKVGK